MKMVFIQTILVREDSTCNYQNLTKNIIEMEPTSIQLYMNYKRYEAKAKMLIDNDKLSSLSINDLGDSDILKFLITTFNHF